MKKFVCFLLCAVLIVCGTLALVGCDKPNNSDGYIDLSKLSEGDEIPVYPGCEFDYKYVDDNKEYILHILSLKINYVKSNKIDNNSIIEGDFYPHTISISISGNTDISLANKVFFLFLADGYKATKSIKCKIDENGKFSEIINIGCETLLLSPLRFYSIVVSL